MKKFGSPELDRILERLDELTGAVLRASSARSRGASAFRAATRFREDNEETYGDLLAALELIGSHLKLLKNPPEEIMPLFRRAQRTRRRRCDS